jgi:hypothetical protein
LSPGDLGDTVSWIGQTPVVEMSKQADLSGPGPPVADGPPSHRRRRIVLGVFALGTVLLVAAAATAGYLALENDARADRWEVRAGALEGNVESLNDLLVERSEALNERTEELNTMARKVQEAEQAIARSEADVVSLERRQRRLANEKAQVEDARAALALEAEALGDVAGAFITCKQGLDQLLGYVLAEDFGAANAVVAGVDRDCQTAEGELSSYLAAYGD